MDFVVGFEMPIRLREAVACGPRELWFAWYPVSLECGRLAFLCHVVREPVSAHILVRREEEPCTVRVFRYLSREALVPRYRSHPRAHRRPALVRAAQTR